VEVEKEEKGEGRNKRSGGKREGSGGGRSKRVQRKNSMGRRGTVGSEEGSERVAENG
jgi:hypothetical protein